MNTIPLTSPGSKAARLPPFDEQAEAGALACVLISANGEAAALLHKLDRQHFYDIRHRLVFETLVRLHGDNRNLTTQDVYQALLDGHRLEDVGMEYLFALPDATPSVVNFESFLETVRDRALRRSVSGDATELDRLAYDTAIPATALADAARRLGESYSATRTADVADLLRQRRFDFNRVPAPLRPIYQLSGTVVSTPGNLTSITAAVKAGKSAVIGAMVASAMAGEESGCTLGFKSCNPEGLALLVFDSEQSPDDHWQATARALKRAGLQTPPPWLHSYCLTGLGHQRAWECVQEAIREAADLQGGIHSILIDGVADLVADVNDAAESNDFVAELQAGAIEHDCSIAGVIHFNPGGEKTRGHLGSQLERKAETNLRLEKSDQVTAIWSDKQRRAPIPKDTGPCFSWDEQAGMHTLTIDRATSKDAADREALQPVAEEMFEGHRSMRYSEMQKTIMKQMVVVAKTAEKKIGRMTKLTLIKKSIGGQYVLSMPDASK